MAFLGVVVGIPENLLFVLARRILPPSIQARADRRSRPPKIFKKIFFIYILRKLFKTYWKSIMGFLGIFWKWFFYHTEVLHLFSRQTEDIMQILNVWNIERKCWQETNSKVSANLWLTFSKNVEQTFLDSLKLALCENWFSL